jgi:hypothetical protein
MYGVNENEQSKTSECWRAATHTIGGGAAAGGFKLNARG